MANQPGDKLRFTRVQAVQLGKFQHVLRTEYGVVAAATFGDIMEQGGDQDQLRVRQTWPQINAQRMAGSRLFFSEAFQLQHDADCVLIYRIGVKQVELHLPDNMRPLWHIGPQYTVSVHRQQTAADGARMTKHAQE